MSYSFSVRAASKLQAKQLVAAEFDKVVASQPVHGTDKSQALAAAETFIDILPDDESQDVNVFVSGYLSGSWDKADLVSLSNVSVTVTASLVAKQVAGA